MSYNDYGWGSGPGGEANDTPTCYDCGGRLRMGTCPRCDLGDGYSIKKAPERPCCDCGRLLLRVGDPKCPVCDPSVRLSGRGRESVLYAEYLQSLEGDREALKPIKDLIRPAKKLHHHRERGA